MLQITIPSRELWDEAKQEFVQTKEQTLQLEHSLVSISKWESKWRKAFLNQSKRTYEEIIDYIRCMTLTQNVNPEVYNYLTKHNIDQITEYINEPMTALYFPKETKRGASRKDIVSEEVYYWMIMFNIPIEFQKWHLNRLLALIHLCEAKNKPKKKGSSADTLRRYAALNAERRKQWNTKG